MTFNDRSFALAQLGYLPVITAVALVLPGAGMMPLLLAMTGSWIITVLCYQASSKRNSVGWWTLLIMQTVLASASAAACHRNPEHSIVALAVNTTLTGIAVIATASLADRLLADFGSHSPAIHNRAMIITAATLPFISAAATATPYPALYAGMALTGYGMTSLQRQTDDRKTSARLWGAFAAGITLIAIADLRFCAATAIGISCMLPWKKGSAYMRGAWMTAFVAAAWIAGNIIDPTAGELPTPASLSAMRLLSIPVDIITLYLAPLPWDNAVGATAVTWYATGALIIYFGIKVWRSSSGAVQRLSACGAILWIATACFFGGDCWRQAFAFLPWMIPGAVAAIGAISADKRHFRKYAVLYAIGVAIALAFIYYHR
ncbi:MAG: hypothetical protein K2L49_01030 [Muribaculaceae bacterium]|nr:hypothetical protein [Muribaculaceae bacterium]